MRRTLYDRRAQLVLCLSTSDELQWPSFGGLIAWHQIERRDLEGIASRLPRFDVDAKPGRRSYTRSYEATPTLAIIHANDQGVIGVRSERSGTIKANGAGRRSWIRREARCDGFRQPDGRVVACNKD